ncbi:MAG: transporter [Bradyrhizobium sp.]|nr:transporter [Bradyrhizobium sp.]
MRDDEKDAGEADRRGDTAAPPSPQYASTRDWLILLLLTASLAFSYMDRFAFALLLEPIKHSLNLNDAQLGLVNGIAFGVFFTVMGIPLGRLGDRWSRKGTIILAMFVWTAATAFCGLASNLTRLAIGRVAVGAGEAGLAPASYSLIYDRFPATRLALALAISQIGANVGAGITFLGGGAAYQLFQNGAASTWPIIGGLEAWQKTFIAIALPGIPLMALLALMREPKRRPAPVGALAPTKLSVKQIGGFAIIFLAFSGGVLTSNALFSWMPALLAREYHWNPKLIGSTYGVIVMFAGPLGMLAGGWISDYRMRTVQRGDHIAISLASAAVALPLMIGVGFCSHAVPLMFLAAILHFFLSLPYGVLPAYIQLNAPLNARGQISAMYALIINVVAQGFGPPLIGFFSNLHPNSPTALRFAMVSVSIPFLTATAISLFFIGRRARLLRKR